MINIYNLIFWQCFMCNYAPYTRVQVRVPTDFHNWIQDLFKDFQSQQQLDLAHRRTDANCIHRKDNAPKPLVPITSEL